MCACVCVRVCVGVGVRVRVRVSVLDMHLGSSEVLCDVATVVPRRKGEGERGGTQMVKICATLPCKTALEKKKKSEL